MLAPFRAPLSLHRIGGDFRISCFARSKENAAVRQDFLRGLDGIPLKLHPAKVNTVYDSFICGRGFAGLD